MSNASIMADKGLVSLTSTHGVNSTTERLENIIKEKGMNVIAIVDHAAGAENIGEKLRPTKLILFGNPQAGTPLMQSSQRVAIDLPQKMLIWEDEQGKVWITYNKPEYLAGRHDINGCDGLIGQIGNALEGLAKQAS